MHFRIKATPVTCFDGETKVGGKLNWRVLHRSVMGDVKDILGIDRSISGRASPMLDEGGPSSKKKMKKPLGRVWT